jgi:glycosyltransferase involved in cell wall biosynthesis
MRTGDLAPEEVVEDIPVSRVPVPDTYTSAEMAEIGQICPAAAAIVEAACPLVMTHGGTDKLSLVLYRLVEKIGRLRARVVNGTEATERNLRLEIAAIRSIMLINRELYRMSVEQRPTLVYCNDLDTLLAGFMLKTNLSIPLIYDAHEIYPEQLATHMRSEIWHQFYSNLEKSLIGTSDGRLTVCDSLGTYFAEEYKAPGFVTIWNVPSKRHLPHPAILDRRNDRRKILYHGSYFAYRGLDEVIEAVPLVPDADFVFRGIGRYGDDLKALSKKIGVEERVTFADPVGVHELVPAASQCDIGLNPFINVCTNTQYALPNKYFEYMMAGLAVASSDLIEMRRLTNRLNVGILFESLAPESIAECLNDFLARPEEIDACRARSYESAASEFNWEYEREKFLSFFSRFE